MNNALTSRSDPNLITTPYSNQEEQLSSEKDTNI